MKAIYTFHGRKIYRIEQDTKEPKVLASAPTSEHSMINADTVLKKITASIYLNTMETVSVKSNKELYNHMKNTIREHQITEIGTIYDRYMMLIDYQLFDSSCEICHNVVTKPIEGRDAALLLGVAMNNELVYRRVKTFEPLLEFAVANQLPLGIMKTADSEYHFKINDISIFQDKLPSDHCNCHNSIYCTPYSVNSCSTVTDVLTDYIKIYSTADAGMQISDIDINFVPKTIDLKINLIMANLIVAYNDADVIATLQEVMREKYHPTPGMPDPEVGPDDSGYMFPRGKEHKPADGNFTPDKNGWYDFYERCLSTNPDALLVVEDLIPKTVYNPKTMIRRKLVVKDIPNIVVGEYVRYVEAHDQNSIHDCDHGDYHIHPEPPFPHHHHDGIDVIPFDNYPDGNTPTPTPDHDDLDDDTTPDDGNQTVDPEPTDGTVDGENTDGTLDGVPEGTTGSNIGDILHNLGSLPTAADRGASLDNTDSASNYTDNMNGFEMVDVNSILI